MAQAAIETLKGHNATNPTREIEFPPPFFPPEEGEWIVNGITEKIPPALAPTTRKIILGRSRNNVLIFERLHNPK